MRVRLALARGLGAEATGHANGLVDDVFGPGRASGVVGEGLQAHPQLVADGPAVGVPSGCVPEDTKWSIIGFSIRLLCDDNICNDAILA